MKTSELTAPRAHDAVLHDRERLNLTGVSDVIRADEQELVLATDLGRLTVEGRELRICRFSQGTGELEAEGQVDALQYAGSGDDRSFWERLFG